MSPIYEFEPRILDLFIEHIDRPIMADPRSDDNEDLRLGFPFEVICNEVLGRGLVDFRVGIDHPTYGRLSAAERARLYAFVNMKSHYFQCLAALDLGKHVLEAVVLSKDPGLVIDIGCGPGTAGLAIATRYPSWAWDYVGIDHAPAMQELAHATMSAARVRGYIRPTSTFSYLDSWEALSGSEVKNGRPTLFSCSYLFASHSLDYKTLASLANVFRSLRGAPGRGPIALLYVNSTNPLATRNYDLFLQLLGLKPDESPATVLTIQYRTRATQNPRPTEFAAQTILL